MSIIKLRQQIEIEKCITEIFGNESTDNRDHIILIQNRLTSRIIDNQTV
jgi:hypothetical protein